MRSSIHHLLFIFISHCFTRISCKLRISPLLCSVKALSCYILKQKCLWSCYVTKTFSPERNFYPYCSRHSHPCNGFFYRIFLSRSFPAEEIGLYQLIFPVYTLAYAATSAGIETALARLVAASSAKKQSAKAYSYLKAALLCSLFLSICCLFLLQKNAVFLTTVILGDPRCASLIFLIAYALPFAALHSCSCGYFLGLKQIRLPALSQLFEQLVRIFFVILLYTADAHTAFTPSVAIAVLGIVGGEIAAAFLCIHKLRTAGQPFSPHREPALSAVPPLLFSALPLTASRVLLNLFQSLEAISIPPCPAKVWNEYLRFS